MEVAATAATVIQLISFTGQVLAAGYGFIAKVQRAPSEIRNLLQETASLNVLLDQLQSLVTDSDDPDGSSKYEEKHIEETSEYGGSNVLQRLARLGVFENCERLMSVVEHSIKACDQIEGHKLKNLGKRVVWPFKEKETKDTMQQLARLRETLSAAVVVDSARSLEKMNKTATEVNGNLIEALAKLMRIGDTATNAAKDIAYVRAALDKSMDEEEILTIERWLYPEGLDSESGYNKALSLKIPETGSWFLESRHLIDWKTSDSGCMWLYGTAGSGKTILAATAIFNLQETSESMISATLYFFCDHREKEKQRFLSLLQAITKQLIEQNPSSIHEVKSWRTRQRQLSKSKALSISEHIDLIKHLSTSWTSIYLVIDALDECSNLQEFVDGLSQLIAKSNLKLLVTSRDDIAISTVIKPIVSFPVNLKKHMYRDVVVYIEAEIRNRKSAGTLKFKDDRLEEEILDSLALSADTVILIAKLHLDHICRLKSDRAIREGLKKLPSSIYEIYDDILEDLVTKYPDDVFDICRTLQWLAGCLRPLCLNELAEAISIQDEDKYLDRSGIATDPLDIAACCGAFVSVFSQDADNHATEDLRGSSLTFISLSHSSVEDYLRSGKMRPSLAKLFPMSMQVIHESIASVCIQYVGFEDFQVAIKRPTEYEDPAWRNSNAQRHILRERSMRYALADYASRYWADHLRLSQISLLDNDKITSRLSWFLHWTEHKEVYISWQQMYHRDIFWHCPDRPPLFYAIEFGIDSLVSLLLPIKEEIDTLHYGQAPLHVAASRGALKTAHDLLALGASIELASGFKIARSLTPLHYAAEGGHDAMIHLLLGHGASVYSQSASYSTPFYRAARSGSVKALEVLYRAGSDINSRTWDDFTPLVESLEQGHSRAAEKLLEWGADPTIKHYVDYNALSMLMEIFPGRTEEHIYQEIISRRAKGKGGFDGFLKNLRPLAMLENVLAMDTRPGTERDKDWRHCFESTMILSEGDKYYTDELHESAKEAVSVLAVNVLNNVERYGHGGGSHTRF